MQQKLNVIQKSIMISLLSLSIVSCTMSDMKGIMENGSASRTTETPLTMTSPNKVKLYYGQSSPRKKQRIIGHVKADNYSMIGVPHAQENIEAELKKQAASIGGLGVINIQSGLDKTSGDVIR